MRNYDNYTFLGFHIPARMMPGIKRYVEDGVNPGGFLTAVIENDLSRAVGAADDENLSNIPAYIGWFYNQGPTGCWGSKEKMKAWIKLGGMKGVIAEYEKEEENGKV